MSPAKINRVLSGAIIDKLKVYNGETHVSMQVEFPYISQILQKPARIITDAKPDFPDDFITT